LVLNKSSFFINNLDSLPNPDYNLISTKKYSRFISLAFNRRRQAVMLSSRGCPFRCTYCNRYLGGKTRPRSAQSVFEEMEELNKNFNIDDFYFLDSYLEYSGTLDLFNLLISKKLKINIYLINGLRADLIDRAFIDKMVKAGVIWVSYAVETASTRLQKLIKRFTNLERLAENIHYTCAKGIMVCCSAMIGLPSESKKEAIETIEFLKQFKKVVLPTYNAVKYFPRTEIYDLALKKGIKLNNIRNAYSGLYYETKYSQTPYFSRDDFINLSLKFFKEICLSKERLVNALEIQKKFYSKEELLDYYSIFFQKRVTDLDRDILSYVKRN